MAKRGLDHARVVDAAIAIADEDGLEAVTLARVAAALGVRSPSLYNHVDGRDGLIRGIAARATGELATALESAQALRALDPQRLAPGHGKVVEAPGAAMERAIARGV